MWLISEIFKRKGKGRKQRKKEGQKKGREEGTNKQMNS